MAKRKRWSEAENKLLLEMVHQGMSVQQIYDSGKFPSRTFSSIQKQLQRLGTDLSGQRKKLLSGQKIGKAKIPDFNEVLARYIDAFNKLCDMTEYTKEELERFRLIFMAAWKYRELFREYEAIEEVKRDVERLKELVAQLQAEKEAQKRRRENKRVG
jgi:hypothetical protein